MLDLFFLVLYVDIPVENPAIHGRAFKWLRVSG
jgi:hypothetical protein